MLIITQSTVNCTSVVSYLFMSPLNSYLDVSVMIRWPECRSLWRVEERIINVLVMQRTGQECETHYLRAFV